MMATDAEQRLDLWLASERSITRHAARTLIDAGFVTVNGRLGRPGQRVHENDVVLVSVTAEVEAEQGAGGDGASRRAMEKKGGSGYAVGAPLGPRRSALGSPPAPTARRLASETPRNHPSPPSHDLNVVYEDQHLAVIDKPAGLVVHPAAGHPDGTLADMLRARGTTWSLLGGAERPGIVHRLDRDTSGLLVVAKTEAAHRALAAQLRDHTLGRTYTAIVHGGFRETTGTIEAPIARDPRNRKRMAVVDSGRSATTDFRVTERLGKLSVLEVQLRTGRTHQIRVHLAYIRHPVVGDIVYGKPEQRLPRLALHAARLSFVHPADGNTRTFESPLPNDIEEFLERTRAAPS
jgi:23S rRNA pseudouridine1911/1915/1917 synthase